MFRSNNNSYSPKLLYKLLMIYISKDTLKFIFIIAFSLMIVKIFKSYNKEIKKFITKEKDIKKVNFKQIALEKLEMIFPYFIALFIPITWYIVILNHSLVHKFFTYRNIMVTFFSFQIIFIQLGKKKENIKN
ncbi:MAG: hypothetical protein HFJ46_03475 [Clostridia bacterium]|nr:hypothetical protein [Clostridia bacterium]